jgi:hypothetical protein
MGFKGYTNLQHTSLWKGNKAGIPMQYDFTACKEVYEHEVNIP